MSISGEEKLEGGGSVSQSGTVNMIMMESLDSLGLCVGSTADITESALVHPQEQGAGPVLSRGGRPAFLIVSLTELNPRMDRRLADM